MHPLYRRLINALDNKRWPAAHSLLASRQDELSQLLPGAHREGPARGYGRDFDRSHDIPATDLMVARQYDLAGRLLQAGASPYHDRGLIYRHAPWLDVAMDGAQMSKDYHSVVPSILDAMLRVRGLGALDEVSPITRLSPLAQVIANKQPEIAEMLLQRGANPTRTVPGWGTPYYHAKDRPEANDIYDLMRLYRPGLSADVSRYRDPRWDV